MYMNRLLIHVRLVYLRASAVVIVVADGVLTKMMLLQNAAGTLLQGLSVVCL